MQGVPTEGGAGLPRLQRAGLVAVYLFSAVALVGFATFGTHPELINRVPGAAAIYGRSFQIFSQGQIIVAFAALAVFCTALVGARWLAAFAALYLLSLGSELMGTTTGLPFGAYRYTDALGPKWFSHVPLLIPLSWFFMALPSYAMARAVAPASVAVRILLGSLILLAWDLSLDPAMSYVTAYWVWENPGAYYGMPWLNLFGWYVTGVVLMVALAALRSDGWIQRLPLRWLTLFYGANLLLPVGMSAVRGLWGAVAATLAAAGLCFLVARLAGFRRAPAVRTVAA